MAGTNLIHLTYDGNFQLETEATVVACRVINSTSGTSTDNPHCDGASKDPNNVPIELELDVTTMHPQGGGQPTDIGTIIPLSTDSDADGASPLYSATIDKVTIDRATGIVTHAGSVALKTDNIARSKQNFFPPNSKVHVSVNQPNRRLLSECHTAGHVVDAAMAKCEKLLPPTKGYHFMDGPYVEYRGSIDVKEREQFLEKLKVAYQVRI